MNTHPPRALSPTPVPRASSKSFASSGSIVKVHTSRKSSAHTSRCTLPTHLGCWHNLPPLRVAEGEPKLRKNRMHLRIIVQRFTQYREHLPHRIFRPLWPFEHPHKAPFRHLSPHSVCCCMKMSLASLLLSVSKKATSLLIDRTPTKLASTPITLITSASGTCPRRLASI